MSRALAVARAWGVPRTLLLALLTAGAAQLVAATYVGLPSFAADLPTLELVPPAAALLLASPLVDQTPDLTVRAGRRLAPVLLLRYAATHAAGAIVVASLAATGWSVERSLAVVLLLSASAVAVAVLDGWYWVPLLGLCYGWLLHTQQRAALADADVPSGLAAAAITLAALVYVAAGHYRLHRRRCPRGSPGLRSWPAPRRRPDRCPRPPC